MNLPDMSLSSVEIKAEEANEYGNFYFETWSNLSRLTLGWMYTLRADVLLWHFLREDVAYAMNFPKIQHWAFRKQRIYAFPEKPQKKYTQMNDTWGRCVPIEIIKREVGLLELDLSAELESV